MQIYSAMSQTANIVCKPDLRRTTLRWTNRQSNKHISSNILEKIFLVKSRRTHTHCAPTHPQTHPNTHRDVSAPELLVTLAGKQYEIMLVNQGN